MPAPIRQSRDYRAELLAGFTVWLLLVVAWFAYRPGLSGVFLFDDWANLPALGAHGPIDTWHAVITYLLSGIASVTGRPVSMLSFLIDANNWPATAEPFKYTNILIHLLNGALLFWVTLNLVRPLRIPEPQTRWIAIFSAGCWLLQPLMVSTTLYVVQRMAMLAATFVFAGLLCYLHGRSRLSSGRTASGYLWMSLGAGVFGLLAALSKGNGALLPLFILIIEAIVLQHSDSPLMLAEKPRGWTLWRGIFLYLPLTVLGLYLAAKIPSLLFGNGYAFRNFTMGERLLTEGRILIHYLYLLIIPHTYTAGLYNDDVIVSTSLFHPWTTLPSLLLIAGLLYLASRVRRHQPMLALAILFFFAGHLLESTFLPLELYFEHRNYLPAAFIYLPVAYWLTNSPRMSRAARVLIGCAVLALLAATTTVRANLWGHPFEQAAVWARLNPDSPRAQTTLALHLMNRQDYRGAAKVLRKAAAEHSDNIMLELNLLTARCHLGGVSSADLATARRALERDKRGGRVAYNVIDRFIRFYKANTCNGLGTAQLESLIAAELKNPAFGAGDRQDMLALRAELRLSEGQPDAALSLFEQALRAEPRPAAALYAAARLGTLHYPEKGVLLLDYYDKLPKPSPSGFTIEHLKALWLHHNAYYHSQINRVRRILQHEAENKPDQSSINGGSAR